MKKIVFIIAIGLTILKLLYGSKGLPMMTEMLLKTSIKKTQSCLKN
ncbi:hypothetical protein [Flavobacterium sp.]